MLKPQRAKRGSGLLASCDDPAEQSYLHTVLPHWTPNSFRSGPPMTDTRSGLWNGKCCWPEEAYSMHHVQCGADESGRVRTTKAARSRNILLIKQLSEMSRC